MKKRNLLMALLLLFCMFTATIIVGCGGGDSGGGDPSPYPTTPVPTTGTITQDNAQKVAYNTFKLTKANPSGSYSPEQETKVMELVANYVNDEIDKGRISGDISKTITDPYDGDGTVVITGSYNYDLTTRNWDASFSMVYENIHVSIPEYTPSDFDASGAITATINFNRTDGTMTASMAYAGYELTNGTNTYRYTGTVDQSGVLENRELASYTSNSTVTMNATTSEGSGSMATVATTQVTIDSETGEASISVSGTLTYSDFDGTSGVATVSTDTPIVVSNTGNFNSGTLVVTDIYGNSLYIEVTGVNTVVIKLNNYTIFTGNLEDFYVPIDVPPYF